jgi:hypothetical protein
MSDETFHIDGSLESADWIKRSWDFFSPLEHQVNMVVGPPDLPLAKQQANVDRFMKLPVARAMPPEVRAGLERRGLRVEAPR